MYEEGGGREKVLRDNWKGKNARKCLKDTRSSWKREQGMTALELVAHSTGYLDIFFLHWGWGEKGLEEEAEKVVAVKSYH